VYPFTVFTTHNFLKIRDIVEKTLEVEANLDKEKEFIDTEFLPSRASMIQDERLTKQEQIEF
jgi:hypothetical protein